MKIIGGEYELLETDIHEYFTDSGRSSIRLILESLKNKTFLIPNYICEIIIKIFNEYKISYSFYKINTNDLTIDQRSLNGKKYDVLYIINYFGQNNLLESIVDKERIVVEDNVFMPLFYNNNNLPLWIGFNSFRKISPLADGSIIKSTIPLYGSKIDNDKLEYSKNKYEAKNVKYKFIHNQQYTEKKYLDLFKLAENKLDRKKSISTISPYSLFRLIDFISQLENEYRIRRDNYSVLYENLYENAIKLKTNHPSFFVICVDNRDGLRNYLFTKKIYCPVHWPSIEGVTCKLNYKSLSIPVDSRYCKNDMVQISSFINKYMHSKK